MVPTRWPFPCVFLATVVCLFLDVSRVRADSNDTDDHIPRIRTTDRRIRALIDEGRQSSATFRALVDRLEASDVVVYVRCDVLMTDRILGGRLTFVSAVGGFRYVVVRMGWQPSAQQQIALLAHELQHAVEIADAPTIIDSESLAREYQRIGEPKGIPGGSQIAFDTKMANVVGHKVLMELNRSGRAGRSD